jgi:DegV family protein with EDD domain
MPPVTIITDTDSSIPPEIATKLNIHQVPINIHFGDVSLRATVDLNDADLFERVDRGEKYPTSSAPSPGQFAQAYQDAFSAGAESVICYCVSAEVSATYNAALQACSDFEGRDIMVVDTRSLSLGQGFLAIAAAEAAQSGASKGEILAHTADMGNRAYLFAALSTLKYLAKSGRLPALQASFGNLLNVKPILTIKDGKLDLLERMRTRKKAWARVIELAAAAAGDAPVERLAIIHINALDEAGQFLEGLKSKMQVPEDVFYAELTPGLSIYGGTGLVGVCFIKGE